MATQAAPILEVTDVNVDEVDLCCGLGDPKYVEGVARKRAWLKERFAEGLRFRKIDVRGKAFIEYAPAEVAWRPIVAPGYLVVHCLWVSGQHARHGYARRLVESCIDDARARGKHGVVVASARRKRPFLGDKRFFEHLGFEVVDTAAPDFVLLAKRFDQCAPVPRYADAVKRTGKADASRFRMTYTDQCPYNAYWAPRMADAIRARGFDVSLARLQSVKEAQRTKSPLGALSLERGGSLVTHHLQTDAGVERMAKKQAW